MIVNFLALEGKNKQKLQISVIFHVFRIFKRVGRQEFSENRGFQWPIAGAEEVLRQNMTSLSYI